MKFSEFSIRRPIFVLMLISSFLVFGVTSYRSIGVSLFPDVDFPIVSVLVIYEGADPGTIETEVTDPIEEAVNTLNGIKSVRSESLEGVCQVFIEFELEVNIDVASQDVRDKIAGVRAELPREIEAPIIEKFDPASAPILTVVISGPKSIRELTKFAKDEVKPRIEGGKGVGSVKLVGGREREVRVWLRSDSLFNHGLEAQSVIDALRAKNIETPGGRIETGEREIGVRTKGLLESVADFPSLIIAHRDGAPIRLEELAQCEDGLEEERSLSRLNGQRAVSLLIRRQSGTNLVSVADSVKAKIEDARGVLPAGFELILAQDLSVFVKQSNDEAQGELIRGGALAVLVLLIFLRSFRGAFVAAVTIPTTIIATYAFMAAMGFTINMMSALALSISVGMIIDDSIVVIENTTRHMEAGKGRFEAAILGISEIGFAVIATSLTIAAVFVPVAFMKGLVGRFFFEFGMTVTFAVGMSTFIALTLSPMLCSRVLKLTESNKGIFRFSDWILDKTEAFYSYILAFALRQRAVVILVALLLFIFSLGLSGFIGKEFVPAQDESQFNVQVEAPLGSSITRSSRNIRLIEARLREIPEVTNLYISLGSGQDGRVNVGKILVQLTAQDQRSRSQGVIMKEARSLFRDLTHLKISVENIPRVSGGGFRAAPLQYNLRGSNLDELDALSKAMMQKMREIPGIVDVNSTYDVGKPELVILPQRAQAADLGVDIDKLGRSVQSLIGGQKASTLKEDGESYDVRARLVGADRTHPESLLKLPVKTKFGTMVQLRNVADVRAENGPVQIDRQNRQRQITIMANLEKSKPLAAAIEDVKRIEQSLNLPKGVTGAFTGPGDMMRESFESMNFTLFLAIVLIYMILAAQFESLIHPLTIMLSLPLSIGGALGALALTGRTLNIFTMIGMIMLMGLVTKNAILLVDYTNLLRSEGMTRREALLKAGPVRLRPILMTAFSTIVGMLPIAIGLGAGAETRAPMGTCVVGGMISSTLLTLIVIPAIYSVLDQWGDWVKGLIWGAESDPQLAVSGGSEAMRGADSSRSES